MHKKFIPLFLIGMLLLTSCYGQKKSSSIPAVVKESFARQFPGVSAKWEKENGRYEASFKLNDHDMSATFEFNGKLIESETAIPINELPGPIRNYISNHYKRSVIKEAAKITFENGTIQYEAAIRGKDLIFDSSGNFVKEVKD